MARRAPTDTHAPGGAAQRRTRAGGILAPAVVGRVSACLYLLCGALVLAVSPLLPLPPGASLAAVEGVGLLAVAAGVLVLSLPWGRWGPKATLWLMPVALAVVALHNLATHADGLRYSLFFMVIFVWLGLAHAPGTSLRFLPMAVVAYVLPLLAVDASGADLASTFYAVPIFGLTGETVAWVGQRALRSERRFRSLVQHATDVIAVVGRDGTVVYDSPAVERVLGFAPGERIGRPVRDFIHEADWPALAAATAELAANGGTATMDVRVLHAEGTYRACAAVIQDLRHDPAVGGFVANFRDVTAEREASERLRHQASHDELTGLANRSHCVASVDELLRAHGDEHIAVLLLDVDRFKLVNDSLGHATGDELLTAVARRLRTMVPSHQLVARLGGDEFVVVLRGEDEAGATHAAAALLAALAAPFLLAGRSVPVAASIGIVVHRGGTSSADELLRDADVAMYAAKRDGGRAWRVFEAGMHAAAVHALETELQLRQGLDDGQFELHYQPLVELDSGTTRGAEALIRWRHPARGLLGPGAFIPTAEDTGLVVDIGRWVLDEACGQLARWHAAGAPHLEIAVNLSVRQLGDPSLVRAVEQALGRAGVPAERVVLEVTESQLVEDTDLATRRLHELKDVGVRIAIDDFGTGHSSLAYLRTFPVDVLKVDRSFVRDMDVDARGAQLVEAILGLGRALHLETVAEGIETANQRRWLQALGCRLGQGYHLGRPVPAADLDLATAAAPSTATG